MNTIFKRVISGAAALGIAVSGLAIGVSTAYAADPTTGSITINKSDAGQVDHSFDGWHLASLTNVTKDVLTRSTASSSIPMTIWSEPLLPR